MKRSVRAFILLICIGFLGIAGISRSMEEKGEIAKGMPDFNSMSREEFYPRQFVKGDVFEVYGEFAYEESYRETLGIKHGSKVTSHYYLIPMSGSLDAGKPMFIALKIKSAEGVRNAELLMQQTWNYIDTGYEPSVWNEFTVQGKISTLDSELEGYLYEWLTNDGENGTRADYADMICPYLIIERDDKAISNEMTSGVVMCLIGFGGVAVTAVITVRSRRRTVAADIPSPEMYTSSYSPVNSAPPQQSGSFGNTTASGSVSSPADGGESARLMEQMSRLSQPADADEFFSKPISRKTPERDTDGAEGLGIGIGDNEK